MVNDAERFLIGDTKEVKKKNCLMEKFGSVGGGEGWLRKGISRRIQGVETASRRKKDKKKCVRGSNVFFYTQQSGPANCWELSEALQRCVEEG